MEESSDGREMQRSKKGGLITMPFIIGLVHFFCLVSLECKLPKSLVVFVLGFAFTLHGFVVSVNVGMQAMNH